MTPKQTAAIATRKERARMDRMIENSFRKNCAGIPISVMDISKVFAAGRAAIESGADLDAAIVAVVETIRL